MQSTEFEYKKYMQLIVRRKELFIALALLFMTGGVIFSYVLPKKYEATSTVFIEKNVISELVKGITVTPSMEDTIKVLTYAITSRTLLNKVADNLDMGVSKGNNVDNDSVIKKLQGTISVSLTRDNNLFTISYTDPNPRMARDVVNTLVRLYIEENTSSKRGESYDATKFLSEQIDTFRTKLEKAETELNDYKRDQGGVIAIDEGRLFEEINLSQQKLYDLELQRRQLEGKRQFTRKSGDPLYANLAALQKRLDELRVEYTEGYPEIIKVKGDIETVREQLKMRSVNNYQPLEPQELEKLESEITAIKSSEDSLRRYIATNQALLRKLPSAKAGLEKLELTKNSQKNIYDQLFARHGQSEVSKQMEVQDKSTTFRIVDPAVLPQRPISPNRVRIMLMGIVGGIAASFGVLMLLEQMDSSVKDVEFVKGLGLPVLAVISRIHNQQEEDLQHRRTQRLFSMAAVYLLFLLCFPLLEIMGITYVDNFLDNMHPTNIVQDLRGRIR
jgi:succinoglycan biosynthesis transport protein ExoP